MSSETNDTSKEPKKSKKIPMIVGLLAMCMGAVGGYAAVQSGTVFARESVSLEAAVPVPEPLPDVTYVPIDPLTISLSTANGTHHLRFSAELEVYASHANDVAAFMPRIKDVLNTYLRAVQVADLEDSLALYRIRSHVLHRVHLVVGEGRVRDVLITEFVMT